MSYRDEPMCAPRALVPNPTSTRWLDGALHLSESTRIVVTKETHLAGQLLRSRLRRVTGLPFDLSSEEIAGGIVLQVDPAFAVRGEEAYTLHVRPGGIVLAGSTPVGILRGIETLFQLLPPACYLTPSPVLAQWVVPSVVVEDAPRFVYRGLLVDVARHFLPMEWLLRIVEVMAIHKLNVLHLHLTDDQGWRMEIQRHPRFHEIGAWRAETVIGHRETGNRLFDELPHGGYYTQSQLRQLVAHAAARGIVVVPEIDMPGHCQAAVASYPELGNNPQHPVPVATQWGPSEEILNVDRATITTMRDVLDEVMDVFTAPYIHIGGDECPKNQWARSERARRTMTENGLGDEQELQGWFMGQIAEHVVRRGRRAAGWEEVLDRRLPEDTVIVAWRGEAGAIAAARAGHDVVMAPYDKTYCNFAEPNDPDAPLSQSGASGLTISLEDVYRYDPVPRVLSGYEHQVLGTEACLWTEYVSDPPGAEHKLFPRLVALAEVAWSARERSWESFMQRWSVHRRRLDALGINYRGRGDGASPE